MTEYAFPRDSLEQIKTRWQTAADQQFGFPRIGFCKGYWRPAAVKAHDGLPMSWDGILD